MKAGSIRNALVVAGVCLPLVGSVYAFTEVYATKHWTNERFAPVEQITLENKEQVRSLELQQVEQTVVLRNLTEVLGELKVVVRELQPAGAGK